MKICVVSNSRLPFLTLTWMCGVPARIRHRLDRAEAIFAGRAGRESAEALEVGVATAAVGRCRGCAGRRRLASHLPDFDDRVLDRLAGLAQHAAGQVRDLADGRRRRIAVTMTRSLSVSSGSLSG